MVACSELRRLWVEQVQDEVEEITVEGCGDKLQYCKFTEVRGIEKVRFGEGIGGIRKIEIQRCGVKKGDTEFEFAQRQDYLQKIECNGEYWDRGEGLSEGASEMIQLIFG